MPALAELEAAYLALADDAAFQAELDDLLRTYVGRPTALTHARRLTAHLGGANLPQTGGSRRIPARTRSTTRWARRCLPATWANGGSSPRPARGSTALRLPPCARCWGWRAWSTWAASTWPASSRTSSACRLLGAEVRAVDSGTRTLKDAVNEAIRDWVTNVGDTYYLLGSALGPHPYPTMVRDFQSVIGDEARVRIPAAGGAAARCVHRVRRRRLERHRTVPRVSGRCERASDRRGGGRRGDRCRAGTRRASPIR